MRNSKPKNSKTATVKRTARIVVKLGWNGSRINMPPESKIDPSKTTLLDVIHLVLAEIPPEVIEGAGEPTILHLRTSVSRSKWDSTKLADVGVEAGGSALLTLNLPMESSAPMKAPMAPTPPISNQVDRASTKGVVRPVAVTDPAPVPMDMDMEASQPQQPERELSFEESLTLLLSNHFDAECRECLVTLCKLLDNLILKPTNLKMRTIRISNPNFFKKVGNKHGGTEFLIAAGFTSSRQQGAEMLTLLPENEHRSNLLNARSVLMTKSAEVGMREEDFPTLPKSSPAVPSIASSSPSTAAAVTSGVFDPYKGHTFNAAAAARGGDPSSVSPDGEVYISKVEKQLQTLSEKANLFEKKITVRDRNISAFRPGESHSAVTQNTPTDEAATAKHGGDGSLLAEHFRNLEEARKKREHGGFTTKAMRDLETLKKKSVYSHAQLRIQFQDGYSLNIKFHPKEKLADVARVIRSTLIEPFHEFCQFDLYVTPPRRILNLELSLSEEGLVPAAKVFVSFKNDTTPPPDVQYIKSELFLNRGQVMAFPNAKKLVDTNKKNNSAKTPGGISKEEGLLKKMMGGKKGMLGNNKKTNGSAKGSGKPSWFKL